jgi:hypothetical protein
MQKFAINATSFDYNIFIQKYPLLTQIPGGKFHLREQEVAPLKSILVQENNWLKKTFGEGFYDVEINFSNESLLLNNEQRKFMIENLSNLPDPIIQCAVKQYLSEY